MTGGPGTFTVHHGSPRAQMASPMFQPPPLPRTLDAALRDVCDPKLHVRRSAVSDLSRLASGFSRAAALEALQRAAVQDADPQLRADAVLALANCEAGSALETIVLAAADPHARVRQMALVALGELGPRGHKDSCAAVVRGLSAEEPALRFQALIAARRHRVAGLEEYLRGGMSDPDANVRYVALRLLEEHRENAEPERASLQLVARALEDTDRTVAVAAAILLAPRGSEPAARVLVEALNRGQKLPAPEDEQTVIELAGELGLAGAIPGLRRHAWGRFGLVPGRFFWQARVVLARLGDEKARSSILRGLRDGNRDARIVAVAAAGRARLAAATPILEELVRLGGTESEAASEALALLRAEHVED